MIKQKRAIQKRYGYKCFWCGKRDRPTRWRRINGYPDDKSGKHTEATTCEPCWKKHRVNFFQRLANRVWHFRLKKVGIKA